MVKAEAHPNLLPYPIDLSPMLALPVDTVDETRMTCNSSRGTLPYIFHPTSVAQCALASWNSYLSHGSDKYREIFMTQADWLLAHWSALHEFLDKSESSVRSESGS